MGDPARWRKWKPSGGGLPKPADHAAEGGFVGFVSSLETAPVSDPPKPLETASCPQVIENKQPADRDMPDRRDQKSAQGGFVGFVSFGSRDTSKNSKSEPRAMSWAEWKAESLNRLFLEQGVTGSAGRITAAMIRDGERKRREQL
jgi:hypothetical protein